MEINMIVLDPNQRLRAHSPSIAVRSYVSSGLAHMMNCKGHGGRT